MEDNSVLPLPQALSLKSDEIRRSGSRNAEDVVTHLYAKMRPSLLSYVFHLVGSIGEAEDLVQIAFLQLFDQLNQNVDIQNLRGWLYRVIHNLAIEQAERRSKKESLTRKWFSGVDAVAGTLSDPTLEESLIKREQIERSLAMLNERERHCLMLRAEGLSYQEIADVLEISAKSVSVYLARALKKFESKHENKK